MTKEVAKELMLGDWTKNTLFDEFEQVDSLEDNNINGHPTDWYEPISLTPEILEKNGFTKENGLYYWTQEKDGKTIAGAYYWVDEKYINIAGYEDDGVTISCHYVHILQHALKLCQIDKEIIL